MKIGSHSRIDINQYILATYKLKIRKRAVVCAGAIVTKDVLSYEIIAGIPAKKIGKCNKNLNYKCNPRELFR